jgi:hypothetical protein
MPLASGWAGRAAAVDYVEGAFTGAEPLDEDRANIHSRALAILAANDGTLDEYTADEYAAACVQAASEAGIAL